MYRFNHEEEVDFKFKPGFDCTGEIVIANFYKIGEERVASANTIPTDQPGAIRGSDIQTEIVLPITFQYLTKGERYSLVIRTEETGVIFKTQIYINGEDS